MKKVLVTAIVMLIACVASASRIDWSVNLRDNATFSEEWSGASIYSYVMLGSGIGTATTPSEFMSTWTADFSGSETVKKGATDTWVGSAAVTGAVNGWDNTLVTGPYAVYAVVVLTKGENGIYSFVGTDDILGLQAYIRGDTEGLDTTKMIEFDPASNWTTFTVPEPTVLALLALGVAGLALKRKNA